MKVNSYVQVLLMEMFIEIKSLDICKYENNNWKNKGLYLNN